MERNFYRAIGKEEHDRYVECGNEIFSGREWGGYELERDEGGYPFWMIKFLADYGGWKEDVNNGCDIPRDIIIRVEGELENEFVMNPFILARRYNNLVGIDMSRASIVYDPRATILSEPLLLNSENVPELDDFVEMSGGRMSLEPYEGKFIFA